MVLSLTICLGLGGRVNGAAPAARMVGVVDFYTPSPLGAFGIAPERFAADDLSTLLAQAAAGRFVVVPRAEMARAQAAMRWENLDNLNFARLRAIAGAVGADSVVVGWIQLLAVVGAGVKAVRSPRTPSCLSRSSMWRRTSWWGKPDRPGRR
jgi:hypothetical protein